MFKNKVITNGRDHLSKSEVRKIYNDFIENYELRLEKARELLGVAKLTYSFDELKEFGKFYYENYKNPDKVNLTYDELLDIFCTFTGDVFVFYFGGVHTFNFKRSDASYGFTDIMDWGPSKKNLAAAICPLDWAFGYENIDYVDKDDKTYKYDFCVKEFFEYFINILKDDENTVIKRVAREMTDEEIRKDFGKDIIIFKRNV
jgi:hypothetical protein